MRMIYTLNLLSWLVRFLLKYGIYDTIYVDLSLSKKVTLPLLYFSSNIMLIVES